MSVDLRGYSDIDEHNCTIINLLSGTLVVYMHLILTYFAFLGSLLRNQLKSTAMALEPIAGRVPKRFLDWSSRFGATNCSRWLMSRETMNCLMISSWKRSDGRKNSRSCGTSRQLRADTPELTRCGVGRVNRPRVPSVSCLLRLYRDEGCRPRHGSEDELIHVRNQLKRLGEPSRRTLECIMEDFERVPSYCQMTE